jgi:hypothetical protein
MADTASHAVVVRNRLMLMSHEPDELPLNGPEPEDQSNHPSFQAFPDPPGSGLSRSVPPQMDRSALSPQEQRLAQLRELRQQRQQFEQGSAPSIGFQRRGLPTPPPPQPPLQEMLKHWWRNGPFPSRLSSPVSPPGSNAEQGKAAPLDRGGESGTVSFLEERARAWIDQGRKGVALWSAKAQKMIAQAKGKLNQKMQGDQQRAEAGELIPGLIVIRFAPGISRQEAVKQISALGGKPLRYKAASNIYQVAVFPGQEHALIEQYRQQPGVISADLERSRAQG